MTSVIYHCPVLEGHTAYISSRFGIRVDPITGKEASPHYGMDLQDALTWTGVDILAFADGVVTEVRDDCTWRWVDTRSLAGAAERDHSGNYVILDHGGGFVTVYKHLELGKVYVRAGDRVKAGTPLGKMGTSGYSTGVHLHFEVRKDGTQIDPEPYLAGVETIPPPPSMPAASDSVPAAWATEDIAWAVSAGILLGDETGNLHLSDPCTRQEMIVFLHRLYLLLKQKN